MSKTYILFPKVLKGEEAEKWWHEHLTDKCWKDFTKIFGQISDLDNFNEPI